VFCYDKLDGTGSESHPMPDPCISGDGFCYKTVKGKGKVIPVLN